MTLQRTTHSTQHLTAARSLIQAERLLSAVLAVLFLGPLAAPLFQATGLLFVADSGALALSLLSQYICPTPAKSYALFGFPMAVCARCWGATIGLWGAWFLFRSQVAGRRSQKHQHRISSWFSVLACPELRRRGSWFFGQSWVVRLCLALGALLLWTMEINAWPTVPLPALIVNGANGGFWAGMFAGSLWLAWRPAAARDSTSTRN